MNLTLFDKIVGGGLLAGKKTYIAAAVLIGTAIAGYLDGSMTLVEMITRLGEGAGLASIRAAVTKESKS
jgi:hypothetical protein